MRLKIVKTVAALVTLAMSGCVVLPEDSADTSQCYLSSNQKYLKVVDLTDGDTSFYDWQGKIIGVISLPTSAVISASYVAVNNVFNFGEKLIKCDGNGSSKEPSVQEGTEH
ncbi:hypothetical protein [uncultured Alteromonas sp.]|uniref:hypothetical protein n=1 Tax=uncultured Alteromonas sp. TaxID=179113 RepID=UPI0025D477DE|nr:hypothetical protein [uncultured Alteromonas sp.]